MICPTCSADTRVVESRKRDTRQYRHRLCAEGHGFVTVEQSSSMTVEGFRRMAYLNRNQKETA